MIGRVKKIFPSHYGFIIDEDGVDYFFHHDHYLGDWEQLKRLSPPLKSEGPVVQFQPIKHQKGMRAEQVMFVGDF